MWVGTPLLAAFMNSITLSVQIVVALWGGGLIGLAIAAAVGALIQRFSYWPSLAADVPNCSQSKAPGSTWSKACAARDQSLGTSLVWRGFEFRSVFYRWNAGSKPDPGISSRYVVLYNLNLLAVTLH